MKKFIALTLSILITAFSFCSCSSAKALTEENITKTVDAAFSALKSFDTEELNKYVDSSTLGMITGYAEKHDQFRQLGAAIFENLTYEIKKIDLDAKTVTVSVANKDLSYTASSFVSSLLEKYSTFQLLIKLDDELWLNSHLTDLVEKIADAVPDPEPLEITLTVTQGKKNLVLGFDETAENAVSGGALGAIKDAIA